MVRAREQHREAATAFWPCPQGDRVRRRRGWTAAVAHVTRGWALSLRVKLTPATMPVLDSGPDLETWYCFPLVDGPYSLRSRAFPRRIIASRSGPRGFAAACRRGSTNGAAGAGISTGNNVTEDAWG